VWDYEEFYKINKKQLDCYCERHEWQEQCSEQRTHETCLQTC
jgi:hypothetical protein